MISAIFTSLVSGTNPSHGFWPANQGKARNVRTMQEAQLRNYQVQDHSAEQDRYYQHLLTSSIDWATKHGKDPNPFQHPELSDIITTSYLVTPFGPWCDKFKQAHKAAAHIDQRGERYARTIQHALSTPEVKSACLVHHPDLDLEKYFQHLITKPLQNEITPHPTTTPKKKQPHKRGELWKIDDRWEHLWPSSRAVFMEILRRTQYPKRPDNFPWCQAGVKSLAKFTNFSPRRIQDALSQLEHFKLIKRIVKGNQYQGCSKYLVFIIPKMSGAFSRKFLHAKKDPPSENPIARLS